MDIQQFLNSVASLGWQGTSLWFVLLGQIILWVGLLRLHFRINRESPNWEECVGKIRSAFLRKINGEEEIAELKIHRYAPSVDRLIELNFREQSLELSSRYLLLKWKIKECIRPYWITWATWSLDLASSFGLFTVFKKISLLKKLHAHRLTQDSCGSGLELPWLKPGDWSD